MLFLEWTLEKDQVSYFEIIKFLNFDYIFQYFPKYIKIRHTLRKIPNLGMVRGGLRSRWRASFQRNGDMIDLIPKQERYQLGLIPVPLTNEVNANTGLPWKFSDVSNFNDFEDYRGFYLE